MLSLIPGSWYALMAVCIWISCTETLPESHRPSIDGVCSEGTAQEKTYLTPQSPSFANQIRLTVPEAELRILFIDMAVGEKMRL